MAITPIPVYNAPFQGGTNGTDIFTETTGLIIDATAEMSFVNDGYTVLIVRTGTVTPNITITSVKDNAGRIGDIGPVALTGDVERLYGPFRPVWWNNGGVVSVTFSDPTDVWVAAIRLQF